MAGYLNVSLKLSSKAVGCAVKSETGRRDYSCAAAVAGAAAVARCCSDPVTSFARQAVSTQGRHSCATVAIESEAAIYFRSHAAGGNASAAGAQQANPSSSAVA